jgi:putative transcriptional regulator
MSIRLTLDQMLAKRRLSLVELSDRTGISVRHLTMLRDQEAVALRLKTLEALCKALNCTPGDLLSVDSETNK